MQTSAKVEASGTLASMQLIVGLLLLVLGWLLVPAALVLLTAAGIRLAFVLAGLAVEAGGLTLVLLRYQFRATPRALSPSPFRARGAR